VNGKVFGVFDDCFLMGECGMEEGFDYEEYV
jgi:hypothetical protein